MEFSVNKKAKKKIRKAVMRSRRSLRCLNMLAVLLGFFGIAGGAVYGIVNLAVPGLSMVNVNGVPTKDTMGISMAMAFLILFGVLMFALFKTLVYRLAGHNSYGRTDEALRLDQDVLYYSFRIQSSDTSYERNLIEIPLRQIRRLTYDSITRILVFKGVFYASYEQFDKKGRKEKLQPMEIREMELCDYFEPGLLNTLKSRGVKITGTGGEII